MTKKVIALAAASAGVFVLSFVGVNLLIYTVNEDQIRLRAMVPEVHYDPGSGPFSAQHDIDIMRLYNNIGRELTWSPDDRDWVAEIIGSGWPDIPVDPVGDNYEAWALFSATLTIIGERIGNGIVTDEHIAQLFRETVIGMIDHPQGRVRQRAATAAAMAGMLDDPDVFAAIERMANEDPHEGARRAARVKLRHYQGIETDQHNCPTCPESDS